MMKLVLLAAGAVIAGTGLWVAIAPGILQGWIRPLTGPQRYLWGAGKVSWGALLIWAAAASTTPLLPQALGSIELVKGIALFVVPEPALKSLVTKSLSSPPGVHRLLGLAVLVIGIMLLATIRPGGGFLVLV